MDLHENINKFIEDLLHVQDVKNNKLLDVYAGNLDSTFLIQRGSFENFSKYIIEIIQRRIGKPANVVLKNSSLTSAREQIVGLDINALDWTDGKGKRDAAFLQKTFISGVYKDLAQKGTNPLYLTVGGIKWMVDAGKGELKEILSPVLIFPIRLVRADAGNTPVYIEFINDDIYVNPCLIAKLKQTYGESVVDNFPHPNQNAKDLSFDVHLEDLGDGSSFFTRLQAFVQSCTAMTEGGGSPTLFSLDRDFVAILNYNHDEICMYYDIQKHRDKIYQSKLVDGIFNQREPIIDGTEGTLFPQFIMPKDSAQEKIIRKVVSGQSMIIKGPPGTGKTLTITNMLASLLAENKKVLLCSKKLGALSEISAKLPEELRKFTMLLDCESEAQAAKLNPSEVRADFIALLNARRKYSPDNNVGNEMSVARKTMYDSVTLLNGYKKIAFEDRNIIGKSYYEVLDMLCDKHIDPVCFVSPQEAYLTSVESFNALSEAVADGSGAFRKITEKAPFNKCPWIPLKRTFEGVDEEKALAKYQEISRVGGQLLALLEKAFAESKLSLGELDIYTLYQIVNGELTPSRAEKLLASGLKQSSVSRLRQLLNDYVLHDFASANLTIIDGGAIERGYESVARDLLDCGLLQTEFAALYENRELLKSLNGGAIAVITARLSELNGLKERRAQTEERLYGIIDSALGEEQKKELADSVEPLRKYFGGGMNAPKALDFKGKSCVKKLSGFGYGESLSFAEIVDAACAYDKLCELEKEMETVKTKISAAAKVKLTKAQFAAISLALQRAKEEGVDYDGYTTRFDAYAEGIHELTKGVYSTTDYPLSALLATAEKHLAASRLLDALFVIDDEANILTVVERAKTALALSRIVNKNLLACEEKEIPQKIAEMTEKLAETAVKSALEGLISLLASFRKECFENYYASALSRPSLADIRVLLADCTDRNVLGSAKTYLSVVNGKHSLPLANFFAPFEQGTADTEESIEEIFKHSVYYLAMECKLYAMGDIRNGLGEKVAQAFDEFTLAEKKERSLTVKHIERMCMSRIVENDPSFAFLNSSKSTGETLRLFFKKNAEGIIKLKRCFLLSPSTASVLLSHPAFFDFDVVICDEASQLEPTALLPLLVRAKQIVLVGDEWQMPPIKRGVARLEKRIDEGDGDYTVLSPDVSALSLALKNRALPTAELGCHYRSNTESLISFSQERFYPFMRTFPAVEPKGEGRGLYDVFVEDGRCEEGENVAEAKQVISLIKEHFAKYYDEQTHILSRSLGVVGFGEKQVKLLEKMLASEKELSKKMEDAKRAFEDEAKEKLLFLKPIDKVQGQEIDHLILSLTYGKNKAGNVVNAFGELNRGDSGDKLGQCIFNVAVTRAKSSVTVVRSVHSYEITSPTISYIADYLKLVERFKEEGRGQFVGKRPSEVNGFLNEIACLIANEGVAESRIVVDYGATKGSVKIPLVVLDKAEKKVQLALWCEVPTNNAYDYFDYNVKYYEILKSRGWEFLRIFIHDWFNNYLVEKEKLVSAIKNKVEL